MPHRRETGWHVAPPSVRFEHSNQMEFMQWCSGQEGEWCPRSGKNLARHRWISLPIPGRRIADCGPPWWSWTGFWDKTLLSNAAFASDRNTLVASSLIRSAVPSTWALYTLRWKLFYKWCAPHQQDPVYYFSPRIPFSDKFTFTLKVYVASIEEHLSGGS